MNAHIYLRSHVKEQEDRTIELAFGKHLRSLREQRNLTMLDLSSRIPMESSSLRRIEKGRTNTSLKTIYKLAKALDVPIHELFLFEIIEPD